jgi:hypothetical protein
MSEAWSARSIAATSGPFWAGCLEEDMVETGDVCFVWRVGDCRAQTRVAGHAAFIKKRDAVKRGRWWGPGWLRWARRRDLMCS